jgi:hypothetical protein
MTSAALHQVSKVFTDSSQTAFGLLEFVLSAVEPARATRLVQTLAATLLALLMSPAPFEPAVLH